MQRDSAQEPPFTAAPGRSGWVLALTIAACVLPLVVAATALALKGWTPVGEFAQAELRMRDFWDHPPTLGSVARLRTDTDVSSHPGPAAWWGLYPVYAAGGRSAVALSTAVAATAAAWIAASLGVAWRRGGDSLTVILGGAILALIAGLGPSVFLEPWNPWFALMAFVALLVAVWAVNTGSRWAIVLATAAGSWCVQAHLGYAPTVAVLGALALFGLWRCSRRTDGSWRQVLWPAATSLALAALMWLPPMVEQLTGDPGNIGVMLSTYRAESRAQGELGPAGALKLVSAYLDPRTPALLLEDAVPTRRGPSLATALFAMAWLAAVLLAVRRRAEPALGSAIWLHVVALASLGSATLAAWRIPGEVFGYLVLWLAAIVTVAMAAIVWTLWLAIRDRLHPSDPPTARPGWLRSPRVLSAAILVAASLAVAISFSDPEPPGGRLSDQAAELVEQAAAGLPAEGDGTETGSRGPFIVRWDDPAAFGALGTALLSELERRGVAVGVDERLSTEMRPHRVLASGEVETALWVVSGTAIEQWRDIDGVREIAYVDPRSDAEAARQAAIEEEIRSRLEEAGVPELSEVLTQNLWVVRSDPSVGPEIDRLIDSYIDLGLPTAVFVAPEGTPQPTAE
jgi:hypothetical protein